MNAPMRLLQSTRRRINLFLDSFSTNIHTCAFHLGNALLSKSRSSAHIKFLSTYLREKLVPNGFQIRRSVNVQCRNHNAVVSRLNQCSRQLMQITLDSNRHCVNIYDQSMTKRQVEHKTLCSDTQFRIIRQLIHNCNSEYYYFISLHKRSKLEKTSTIKPFRQCPMDDKLVVTIHKDLPLSSSEMSILKQGLSFIPTPHTVDEFEIRCDIEKFARLMRLFAHLMKTLSTSNRNYVKPLQPTLSTIRLMSKYLRRQRGPLLKVSIHHLMCSFPNAEFISTTFYATTLLLCTVTLPVRTEIPSSVCRKEKISWLSQLIKEELL